MQDNFGGDRPTCFLVAGEAWQEDLKTMDSGLLRVDLPESPVHGGVPPKPKAPWGKTKGAGKRIRSGTRPAGGGLVAFALHPLAQQLAMPADRLRLRSEEHTSELQSLMRISYAVFCFKKKNDEL